MKSTPERLTDLMLGLATGDALGVPFEFQSRAQLYRSPCTGMVGYGSHHQPPGTWSDDTSMALILLETLQVGGSLADELEGFRRWYRDGYRTAHGVCFDIGGTTRQALDAGQGLSGESSNGNGSLMRIAPLAFFLEGAEPEQRRQRCFAESAITHAHLRSQLGCWLLVEILLLLAKGDQPERAVDAAWQTVEAWAGQHSDFGAEWLNYRRCTGQIAQLKRTEISSSGYVVHTLEASLWCLLTQPGYGSAVLAAVNLGSDTDTTGAVTGALAGLVYGQEGIPAPWLAALAQKTLIEGLCRLNSSAG